MFFWWVNPSSKGHYLHQVITKWPSLFLTLCWYPHTYCSFLFARTSRARLSSIPVNLLASADPPQVSCRQHRFVSPSLIPPGHLCPWTGVQATEAYRDGQGKSVNQLLPPFAPLFSVCPFLLVLCCLGPTLRKIPFQLLYLLTDRTSCCAVHPSNSSHCAFPDSTATHVPPRTLHPCFPFSPSTFVLLCLHV